MTIKLNPLFLDQADYITAFNPDKEGNVTLEAIKNNYKVDDETALKIAKGNITVFTVTESEKKSK